MKIPYQIKTYMNFCNLISNKKNLKGMINIFVIIATIIVN